MKKNVLRNGVIALAVLSLMANFAWTEEIDENEIKSASSNQENIQFINYNGTHAVIESASAIRAIGTTLGQELAQKLLPETNSEAEEHDGQIQSDELTQEFQIHEGQKYSVIHSPSEKELLGADILILSEQAGVDHIKNLRRIIAGFLESAYNYTSEDSDTISVFITVYNAVYRSQFSSMNEKYSPGVLKNLDPEKSGLSSNWEEWAGNTQIVIPLKALPGTDSVDTSSITDEKVIDVLRNEDDMGIDEREKMAQIKEREVEDANQNAKDAQKEAAQKRNAGDEEGAKKASEDASKQQKFADKTRSEVQEERKQLTKDSETVNSKTETETVTQATMIDGETGLFGPNKKGLFSLIKVNTSNGEIVLDPKMNQIRSKAVFEIATSAGKKFVAVCGENTGKSPVKLCLIDAENLLLEQESQQVLYEKTDLIPLNDSFIVVAKEGKNFYLALFDKNLEMKAKSSVAVNPDTPVNMNGKGILVTQPNGKIAFLSAQNLSSIW